MIKQAGFAFGSMQRSWPIEEAKSRFSELVEAAKRKPQTVTKHGKPAAVVLGVEEYGRLRRLERAQVPSLPDLLLAMPQNGDDDQRL